MIILIIIILACILFPRFIAGIALFISAAFQAMLVYFWVAGQWEAIPWTPQLGVTMVGTWGVLVAGFISAWMRWENMYNEEYPEAVQRAETVAAWKKYRRWRRWMRPPVQPIAKQQNLPGQQTPIKRKG